MESTDRRFHVAVLGLVALLAHGCSGTFSWQTITKGASVPTALHWRSPTEVWASGGQGVLRRVNGAWEGVELCAPYDMNPAYTDTKRVVTLAFEGQVVWALCGRDAVGGQVLLRHDGQGTATVIELPVDGVATLVPLVTGPPAILAGTSLWTWTGDRWKAAGRFPASGHLLSAAGVAADEIYVVTDGVGGAAPLTWWNGQKWQPMLAGTNAHGLELRFDKVWMGLSSLSNGEVTPLEFKGAKALADNNLTLTSLLTEKTALATANHLSQYWIIGVDDAAPVKVGQSPKENGQSTPDVTVVDIYGNTGTVFGSYSPGKGIGRAFGIDASSIAIVYFVEGGAYGGGGSEELIEGRL